MKNLISSISVMLFFASFLRFARQTPNIDYLDREGICDLLDPLRYPRGAKIPERRQDKMTNLKKVGEGAFGHVYAGLLDGQSTAFKKIKIAEDNALEIKLLKDFSDIPGIPKFIGCEKGVENYYLYQQALYKGMNEPDVWQTLHEKPLDKRLELFIGMITTLKAIHKKGYLHRDMKPSNMMASNKSVDQIFIIDFGCTTLAKDFVWGGSPMYMSPELRASKSHSSDIKDENYALGFSIAEMEVGESNLDRASSFSFCAQRSYPKTCHDKLIGNFKTPFNANRVKLEQECGKDSVDTYFNAITKSIAYYARDRSDTNELFKSLESSLEKCKDYKNAKLAGIKPKDGARNDFKEPQQEAVQQILKPADKKDLQEMDPKQKEYDRRPRDDLYDRYEKIEPQKQADIKKEARGENFAVQAQNLAKKEPRYPDRYEEAIAEQKRQKKLVPQILEISPAEDINKKQKAKKVEEPLGKIQPLRHKSKDAKVPIPAQEEKAKPVQIRNARPNAEYFKKEADLKGQKVERTRGVSAMDVILGRNPSADFVHPLVKEYAAYPKYPEVQPQQEVRKEPGFYEDPRYVRAADYRAEARNPDYGRGNEAQYGVRNDENDKKRELKQYMERLEKKLDERGHIRRYGAYRAI